MRFQGSASCVATPDLMLAVNAVIALQHGLHEYDAVARPRDVAGRHR